MTQYLILMFVMTLGSLTAFGQFGQKSQHQVAMVAGKAGGSYSSTAPTDTSNTGNQSNSPYSGAGTTTGSNNPSVPTDTTTSSNPVTTPTGNTTPAVPNTSPPDTVANNPVTNPSTGTGSSNQNNNGNQSGNNTSNNNSGNSTGQTNLGGGTTTTETEPPPLCTKEGSTEETPEITEDKSQVKEEDKGIFGSLWDDFKAVVKDTVIAGYEFIKGFWEGMKAQIADLANLLTNPKEVVMGLIELGKQFVKEPAKTAKMIADSLGDNYQNYVRNELKKLDEKYRKSVAADNPWSQEKILSEIEKFEEKIKNDLITGKAPPLCADCKPGRS